MTDAPESAAWLEREDASRVSVGASCAIGRAPTNHVVLGDEKVSRKHALIHRQGDNEYWLVDLGSSNGSYLDGRRVTQPVVLLDGAVMRIGSSTLLFRQRAVGAKPVSELGWDEGTVRDVRIQPCWLLVADMEGSTELSRGLPADEMPIVTGRWFSDCKQAVEANGGLINKYLGDGFFAYWIDLDGTATRLARALDELKRLQAAAQPRFRVVLHHGLVSLGGAPSMGEESLSGPEVNFIFRMEKLAGTLKHVNLMSENASTKMGERLHGKPAGRHALSGFEGTFGFVTF